MSNVEEIERAVEQLPLQDFVKLAQWFDERRRQLQTASPIADADSLPVRDHSAFLNSYCAEDEGLYDDATSG